MAHRFRMTLYSQPRSVHSHRIRLVMAEKEIASYRVIDVEDEQPNEDLMELNPYGDVPTLVEREAVVYDARVILEYLDERYPYPPLLPVEPISRAHYRAAALRMEKDLYTQCESLKDGVAVSGARKRLQEMLTVLATGLAPNPYLGAEFSLLDCTLAPVLWRLAHYQIKLPARQASQLKDYARHLFARPAFQRSLSAWEARLVPFVD